MVWVSNLSNVAITVSITNTTGGNAGQFIVAPFISAGPAGIQIQHENWADNHWGRGGPEQLVAQINGMQVAQFQVNANDHVTFNVDAYEVVAPEVPAVQF